jgi:hypothetical protein
MPTIERVFEPSRIRLGRTSTTPTWHVVTAGVRWRFTRKRDAQAFIDGGCVCPDHSTLCCHECSGTIVAKEAVELDGGSWR